jgi:two-component system response regulator FixJ
VVDALELLLVTEGYVVRTYASTRAFLDTIRQRDRGCTLTHVNMPETSGSDLLAALRGRGVTNPVIVLTGRGDASLAVAAMRHGAFDVFEKPFDPDALLAAIRSALRRGNDQ